MKLPSRRNLMTIGLALVAAGITVAEAQRGRYDNKSSRASSSAQHTAGDFDYYALVLSWSPTHCATPKGRRDRTQCNPPRDRGFSFILHGLWPQYERGYPSNCDARIRRVSNRTISSIMDIMPSKGLIIHEYRKHGTCSGLTPENYFKVSRQLYDKIKIPAAYRAPQKEQFVSPEGLIQQFTAANPGLNRDMMRVVCRGSGNRLREVRFCFSKEGNLRSCGRNENQRRLCSAKRIFVPPVRYNRR